jgi:hypothetical protein
MFVSGQDKCLKARRLVGHFARQALCWARVRREPLVPYRRQSEDYRETGFEEISGDVREPNSWPVSRDFLLIKRIRRFARHSDDASFLTEHIARAFSRR